MHQYVASKSLAWAPSTVRSEASRLYKLANHVTGAADYLYAHLASTSRPYSIVTAWTRVVAFYDYLIETGQVMGPNPYTIFRRANSRLFKNKYQTKIVNKSFDEVRLIVDAMSESTERRICAALLFGGLRLHEVNKLTSGGVEGKGGKVRPYFGPSLENTTYTQQDMAKARARLKSHGLTPHDLRRLCATELVAKGLKEADLLKVMGWSSILTAKAYLQPKRDAELQSIMTTLRGDSNESK